jgi:hypothetical protein
VAAFTDDFTGSNNDALEGRSGWTRDGGAAGAAAVNASNQLKGASATDTGYYAPDTGSADHYCQGSIKNNAHSSFPLICRYQDRQNWGAGLRIQSVSSVRLYTRVAGGFTELANYGTPSGGFNAADVWRVEVSGSTATIYRNGSFFASQAISNFPTATKVGLNARTATYDPWLDDWESDALAGSGDATASGTTFTETWSLSAGAPGADSLAAGTARTLTWTISAGTAAASSTAAGTAQTATWTFAAGSASGVSGGTAAGATFSLTWSLAAGAATASSTAGGLARTVTWTLAAGGASAGGSTSATAAGAGLTLGWDFIPGAAFVANNFHATGPVRIPRALATQISAIVAPYGVTVERERRTAIEPAELPRVLLYSLDSVVVAEFAGASSLRSQRVHVEVVDAVRTGDDFDAVQDRVAALVERIRLGLDANPTLAGATLGLTVEEGGTPRAGDPDRQDVEARVLLVSADYCA